MTLAQILRMRAEVQDRAEAKMAELTRARAGAFRRAEAEAGPKMREVVDPIVAREMESVAPIQAEADAAAAEIDALDDVIGPHLESGRVALFLRESTGPGDPVAAFLDEGGDVILAPTFGASSVLADDPPVAPPSGRAAEAEGRGGLLDQVADAVRKALGGGVVITRVEVDPATGRLACGRDHGRARREAEAVEPSPVVEDQAAS